MDESSLIGIEFTFEETKSRLNLQNEVTLGESKLRHNLQNEFTFEDTKSRRHNLENELSFEEDNKSRFNFEDEQTKFGDELITRHQQKQKFKEKTEKTENNYQCFIKSR